MKTSTSLTGACCAVVVIACAVSRICIGAAVPTVSVLSTSQDADTSMVTVRYTLADAPAIVTIDIQTNAGENAWSSIGGANQHHWAGDVNRLVPAGDGKTREAFWMANADWPGFRLTDNVRAVVTAWMTNSPPDYMVLDLATYTNACFYTGADALPGGVGDVRYKSDKLVLRRIPAANVVWNMGSPNREYGRNNGREGVQKVMLTEDYWLGVYELTQAQYRHLYKWTEWADPEKSQKPRFRSTPKTGLHPVESVTPVAIRGALWDPYDLADVTDTSVMGRIRRITGVQVDLPTAAQWEFACRAGSSTAYHNGGDPLVNDNVVNVRLGRIAWYTQNWADDPELEGFSNQPHEVGLKEPNGFGLYDMLGNVQEFGLDWNTDAFTPGDETVVDPKGPSAMCTSGNKAYDGYVWCGGAYNKSAAGCRAASRYCWGTGGADEVGMPIWAPLAVTHFNKEAR